MLNVKRIISILLAVSLMALAGCNSVRNQNSQSNTSEKKKISKEEGTKAKNELLDQLTKANYEVESAIKAKGYIGQNEYFGIRNDVNLLAYSLKSKSSIVDINDNSTFKKSMNGMEKQIHHLSYEAAANTLKRMNSEKVLYESLMIDDIHTSMRYIDLSSMDSRLTSFVSMSQNGSKQEITDHAKSDIQAIQDGSLRFLNNVQTEIDKHKNSFKGNDLELLKDAVDGLKSSGNQQIEILKEFDAITVSDGTSIEDKVNSAKNDFDSAQKKLDTLESRLDVIYKEDN